MSRKILLLIILVTGCISQVHTAEEAQQIAADYIKNAPTYMFDGIPKTFKVTSVEPADCEGCFEVIIEFDSAYPGYGTRSVYFLIRKISHHTARVRVEKGQVTEAILDDLWDEMAQESLV